MNTCKLGFEYKNYYIEDNSKGIKDVDEKKGGKINVGKGSCN